MYFFLAIWDNQSIRVEEMSKSLGVDVGGAHDAGEEQCDVLGLAVGERMDRLEIRMG